MLVDSVVRSIAVELNDFESGYQHTGWPLVDLHDYIAQGLAQVAVLRPELFTESRELTLVPGAYQTLPVDIVKLIDISSNVGPDGAVGGPVYPSNFDLTRSLQGRCLQAAKGDIVSWARAPNSTTAFFVSPPVSAATPTKVQVLAQVKPPAVVPGGTLAAPGGDLDTYFSPIFDWALFRAFMKDTESQSSLKRAEIHYRAHYQFFGVKANMDAFGKLQRDQTTAKVTTNE